MLSVARVAYKPLKVLALNVIAVYSRARRKRRKPDRMTSVELLVKPHYSVAELTELRRYVRYARSFPSGYERNQHRGCLAAKAFQEREVVARSRSERFLIRLIGVFDMHGPDTCPQP
jgi:hypothetical protein